MSIQRQWTVMLAMCTQILMWVSLYGLRTQKTTKLGQISDVFGLSVEIRSSNKESECTATVVSAHLFGQFVLIMWGETSDSGHFLPSVFCKTDSVFQKCVFNNTYPRACISQYNPKGVYRLVQALGHVLCNTHS